MFSKLMPKGSLNRFGLVPLAWKRSLLLNHFTSIQGGQQKAVISDYALSGLDRLIFGLAPAGPEIFAQQSSQI